MQDKIKIGKTNIKGKGNVLSIGLEYVNTVFQTSRIVIFVSYTIVRMKATCRIVFSNQYPKKILRKGGSNNQELLHGDLTPTEFDQKTFAVVLVVIFSHGSLDAFDSIISSHRKVNIGETAPGNYCP